MLIRKGQIYHSCVMSMMLYESKTWFLSENEITILRRTEKAIIRAIREG